MRSRQLFGLLLVAPALALVATLFLYPLAISIASAFSYPDGGVGLGNFAKALELCCSSRSSSRRNACARSWPRTDLPIMRSSPPG
jgi:ABC-type sugar transport system permease subunit